MIRHEPDPDHPGWWTWEVAAADRFNGVIGILDRPLGQGQAARSAISFLVSAIALAGFSPFGQTLAQFMIVWQR